MKRQRRRALERSMRKVARSMATHASLWEFDGTDSPLTRQMIGQSRLLHHASGAVVIFTRDTGHHTSGWMRNPDYERCLHLSLSPIPPAIFVPGATVDLDEEITRMWCEAFFGAHLSKVWAESPKSTVGRRAGVWHWRLFCDEHWRPIIPRGEVYSSELTEKGWKSASEIFELTGRPEPVSTVDPT